MSTRAAYYATRHAIRSEYSDHARGALDRLAWRERVWDCFAAGTLAGRRAHLRRIIDSARRFPIYGPAGRLP